MICAPVQFAGIYRRAYIYICVERTRYSNFYSARAMIIFSATACTSCARSLFFTTEDFQTPHVPRTLSSTMKKHLRAASYRALIKGHFVHSQTHVLPHVRIHNFVRPMAFTARFLFFFFKAVSAILFFMFKNVNFFNLIYSVLFSIF